MNGGLIGLLRSKGIEVRESTVNSNEFTICCLFCTEMGETPDYRFRLGFNIESGLGHCHNCGWSSRKALIEIFKKVGGTSAGELSWVYSLPYTGETRKRPEKVELPEGYETLIGIKENDPELGPALKYVTDRGITKRQIREKEIGACFEDERYKRRIIFPVKSQEGELLGIVARDWTGISTKKYLNSTGAKSLYNVRTDVYSKKLMILSEGIVKALAIERATRYKLCSAASLGNNMKDTLVNQLTQFEEVCLFPDPDAPGMRGFIGIAQNLEAVVKKVSMAWPWPKKQADDLKPEEIREAIRNRKPYTMTLEWRLRLEIMKRA